MLSIYRCETILLARKPNMAFASSATLYECADLVMAHEEWQYIWVNLLVTNVSVIHCKSYWKQGQHGKQGGHRRRNSTGTQIRPEWFFISRKSAYIYIYIYLLIKKCCFIIQNKEFEKTDKLHFT